MLQPRKVKHRKHQKGRRRERKKETRGTFLAFGSYGLQALENVWLTSNQIEAARKVLVRHLRKGGKLWIRVFPDKPITKKPSEVKMGGGKGDVVGYVAPVRPGRIIFEIDGIKREEAFEALREASSKLPTKTRIVEKTQI
ncbi:MAG TPA: 50S ribosomal protein L16 [bacterium]|nr:50S ribosomal protein L16 [bacterium]